MRLSYLYIGNPYTVKTPLHIEKAPLQLTRFLPRGVGHDIAGRDNLLWFLK